MARTTQPVPSASLRLSRTLLLATDLQQSILAELDRSGPNIFAYTAYGSQSSRLAARASLGFNGQLKEQSTGWYHLGNGHRVYNPMLMRLHSPDRLSPFGKGGLNAYAYCSGSPVNRVDPTGQFWLNVTAQSIGVVVGGFLAWAPLVRTMQAVVNHTELPWWQRVANVLGFQGGVHALWSRPLAIQSAMDALQPGPQLATSLGGNSTSQFDTIGALSFASIPPFITAVQTARAQNQSLARVGWEVVREVTGYNLITRNPTGNAHRTLPVVPLTEVVEHRESIRGRRADTSIEITRF